MKHPLVGLLLPLMVGMMSDSTAQTSSTDRLLVFISSFAGANDGAIQAFHLDRAAGTLTPARRTTGIEHPFFLALSPDRRFLYSIQARQFGGTENEHVAAYAIAGTGELTLLNRQSSLGTASCYLDVDASGKTLLVANYSTGSVAALPVRKDGSLGEAAAFVQHAGSSVDPARQTGPHAHCIVVSPDNRHAYSADLGMDQIVSYRLDAPKAKLFPNRQPFVRTSPGAGPRHLRFHPNGRHLYVINEMGNSITLFDYEPETGVLIERQTISTLPKGFDGKSHCADLKITPDGRFLYGTNRGHDSIAAYRLADDGRLTLIGIHPSLGKGPQNLAIVDGGKLLLCANMPGNNVAVFRIDPQTGGLSSTGEPVAVTSPSCIRPLQ
ncbi:MAG: 6-phosphogluconolactonase [Acidobacteria bacterium]|nr:MAG: 6-phosphogluconolactonase [Acidobacteriota bacterium]